MKLLSKILSALIILSFIIGLASCNTVRKAVSRNSSTAHIEQTISKDSSYNFSNDSTHVKRDTTSKTVSVDSIYDYQVTIEEELFRDSVVMTYKRKTTIQNKGRYVFESLEAAVKADSLATHKAVNVERKELIIKDSTHIYKDYSKNVERKHVPVWLVAVVFAVVFAFGVYKYRKTIFI